MYDEDHLPKVLDLKQKMCNVYLNDELLYTDCTSLEEHYDATFDKLTLMDWEAKKLTTDDYDFTFTDFDVIDTAND